MKASDHTGKRFHKLTAIERVPGTGRPGARWRCRCDCGATVEVQGIDLASGKTKSCGCYRLEDFTGKRFGRWTATRLGERSRTGLTRWHVRCDCGTQALRHATALKSGRTKSCGCYQAERRSLNTTRHGSARPGRKTPTYNCWVAIHARCSDLRDPDYGGRGISVCAGWRTFEAFLADMGERPAGLSIDRIDTNEGYSCGRCPECVAAGRRANCRWATKTTQSRNRRNTVLLTKDGATRPMAEWAELLGLKYMTIHRRLRRGASHEKALAPILPS